MVEVGKDVVIEVGEEVGKEVGLSVGSERVKSSVVAVG